MKTLLTTLVVAFIVLYHPCMGQKKKLKNEIEAPVLPISSSTKLVNYNGVVDASGTAAELYKNGWNWFTEFYKNPSNVIREKVEGEKIVGKARYRLWGEDQKTGVKTNDGIVQYDISVQFKDGRFRYEITNIEEKKATATGIEYWTLENEKRYSKKLALYLVQTDEYFQSLIADLKSKIVAPKANSEEDDW